jgi:hypothetical protein
LFQKISKVKICNTVLPEDTDEDALIAKTQRGEYAMKSDSWMSLSLEAMDFTQATLLHRVFGTDVS